MAYNKGKGAYRDYDTRSEEAVQLKQEMLEEQKALMQLEQQKILDYYKRDQTNPPTTSKKKYKNNVQNVMRKLMQCEYTEKDGTRLTIAEKMGMATIASFLQQPNAKDLQVIQKILGEDGTNDMNLTVSVESLIKKVTSDEEF